MPALGLLSSMGPLSIAVYVPALPGLIGDLGASDSAGQLTLGAFTFGIAAGQLLLGPLSDRFGRRPILLLGIVLYIAMSIACALAPTVGVLIGARFAHGIAGSAGIVVSRAVIRDTMFGDAAARAFALFGAVIGIAPVVAPLLGALLLRWTDWRGVFAAMAVIGGGMLLVALRAVPETLAAEQRTPAGPRSQAAAIGRVLSNGAFVAYVLVLSLASLGLFAYVSMSPIVLQHEHGFDEQMFALVFAVNGAGVLVGSLLSRAFTGRLSAARLAVIGVGTGAVGAVGLLVAALVEAPLPFVLAALFVAVLVHGANIGNLTGLAMTAIRRDAGVASAVLGAVQMSMGAFVPPLASAGGATALVMGITMSAGLVGALVLLLVIRRRA